MDNNLTPVQWQYMDAVRVLNDAAYAALRAGKDTTELPMINRQALREIAVMSDALLDRGIESGRRRDKAPVGECKTCDRLREKGADFHPPHDASDNCQSGRRNHCSCDTCF